MELDYGSYCYFCIARCINFINSFLLLEEFDQSFIEVSIGGGLQYFVSARKSCHYHLISLENLKIQMMTKEGRELAIYRGLELGSAEIVIHDVLLQVHYSEYDLQFLSAYQTTLRNHLVQCSNLKINKEYYRQVAQLFLRRHFLSVAY